MSAPQDEPRSTPRPGPHAPEPRSPRPDEELLRAQELLARTMRFLAQCAQDPEAAVLAEDPQALIRDLQSLAVVEDRPADASEGKLADDSQAEPRTIHIRRRKSA